MLSKNPAAIHLLEADKIDWIKIWRNPAIFVYDYKYMKTSRADLHAELVANVFHPGRLQAWVDTGRNVDEYLIT